MAKKWLIALLALLPTALASLAQTPELDEPDEEQHKLDSLVRAYQSADQDTMRLRLLSEIALNQTSTDSTFYYAQKQLDLAKKLKDWRKEASALQYMAWAKYYDDNHLDAAGFLYDAITLLYDNKDTVGTAECYNALAKSVAMLGNNVLADTYFHHALNLFLSQNNTSLAADVYRNIGHSAVDDKMFSRATICFDKAKDYDTQNEDTLGIIMDYYYYGYRDLHMGKYTSAIEYHEKCIKLSKEYDDPMSECDAQQQIANTWIKIIEDKKYADLGRAQDSCLAAAYRTIELAETMGINRMASTVKRSIAELHKKQGKYAEAQALLDECEKDLEDDKCMEHKKDLYEIYKIRAGIYRDTRKHDLALAAMDSMVTIRKRIANSNFAVQSMQNMARREFDIRIQAAKQSEHEHAMMRQAESQGMKLLNVALVIGLLVVLSLGLLAMWESQSFKKSNLLLDQKNTLLAVQNNVAQQQTAILMGQRHQLAEKFSQYEDANKRLTSGFKYASLMQQAIMPTRDIMDELFGQNIVILKPLDIVSGDFFWATKLGNLRVLVVADCTGHGVPGAFMSMWGVSMLNDIFSGLSRKVSRLDEISPAGILGMMRLSIKHGLRQKGGTDDNQDGMDMAMIVLDATNRRLKYAGANRPLVIAGVEGIRETAADRMPVGVGIRKEVAFTDKDVELFGGDIIYLFSDGMTDQFGYSEDGKQHRLGLAEFRKWLKELSILPMAEQQKAYEALAANWHKAKGPAAEMLPPAGYTDDAILVGIKIAN